MKSACALAGSLASVASADVLYSLGAPNPGLSFASDAVPDQFNNQRLAERFILAEPSTVSLARWWGHSEFAFFPDLQNMETFSIAIHDDEAGLPGVQLFDAAVPVEETNPTDIGMVPNGATWYRHEFTFAKPIVLDAGAYWISLGTDNFDPDGDGWYWSASLTVVSDDFAAQIPVGDEWESSGFADLAFEIEGEVVPAPMTLALLAAGLAPRSRRR